MTTTNTTTIPMPPIGAIRAIMRLRKRSPEIDQRVLGAIVLAANYMPDGDWSLRWRQSREPEVRNRKSALASGGAARHAWCPLAKA